MSDPSVPEKQTFSPWGTLLKPSLTFGGYSGALGLGIGSLGGILSSQHPALFAILTGGQWFLLGIHYQLARSAILTARPRTNKREVSTIAGAFSGASVAAFTRGPRNILPGAFMFGCFGFIGQYTYERIDASHSARDQSEESETLMESWANAFGTSKWSPLKKLDNQQYQQLMHEKLVRLEAELAIVEEDIAALKQERETKPSKPASETAR